MKKMALILPLATALLLSACNNANEQTPKTMETQTDNTTQPTAHDNIHHDNVEAVAIEDVRTEMIPKAQVEDKAAANDAHKKDVIKFLYRDAALSLTNDNNANDINTLFAYADRDLQNAIALVKADSMNTYEGYADEISNCNAVYSLIHLSVGNGYSINEAADVKYKVLDNGNVRASILLDGDEDIDAADFNSYKDFSLSCSSEGCKITDMFDSYGDSALQAVEDACR